jgi:hypothetical protein
VSTEELRAQLAVAELEEELADLKDGGDEERLRFVKEELRYRRWVARGGPAEEEARLAEHARQSAELERLAAEYPDVAAALAPVDPPHTNRHVAELYTRWLAEKG